MQFLSKPVLAVLAVSAFGAAAGHPAAAQSSLSTVPSWNGSDYAFPFGTSVTATYGEVITAPQTQLKDFTFYFQNYDGGSYQTNAYVYAWNGTNATGSALASSGPYTVANGTAFAPITFAAPATLSVGQQYVLFVNTSATYGTTPGGDSKLGAIYTDPYAGGQYVFYNNNDNFGLLTTTAWDHYSSTSTNQNTYGNGYDLAFTADFGPAAVPEASTTVSFGLLLTLGLGAMAVAARRRKASNAL